MAGRRWTYNEDALLRQAHRDLVRRLAACNGDWNRPGQGVYQRLALRMDRTVHAIRQRAHRLGLKAYESWQP